VGRHDLHLVQWGDPHLHARRALALTFDPQLTDAAHLVELGVKALPGKAVGLEAHAGQGLADRPAAPSRCGLARRDVGQRLEVENGVALAREAVVQLGHDPARSRHFLPQVCHRLHQVICVAQVLTARWLGHPGLREDPS